jgi:hypothetical protein
VGSKIIGTVKAFRWQQWLVVVMFLLVAGFTAFKALDMAREVPVSGRLHEPHLPRERVMEQNRLSYSHAVEKESLRRDRDSQQPK